jgi:hypothetical protein
VDTYALVDTCARSTCNTYRAVVPLLLIQLLLPPTTPCAPTEPTPMKALQSSSSASHSSCLRHRHDSSRCWRAQQQKRQSRRITAGASVVEPAQLAAIAAEPVAEVALLAGVGAVCAKQGLLPLQGR